MTNPVPQRDRLFRDSGPDSNLMGLSLPSVSLIRIYCPSNQVVGSHSVDATCGSRQSSRIHAQHQLRPVKPSSVARATPVSRRRGAT